jgi:uncharacterized protein YkwD
MKPRAHRLFPLPLALAGALALGAMVSRLPASPSIGPLAPTAGPRSAPAARSTGLTPVEELEQRVFQLTNERRRSASLRRLEHDADLSLAARRHSEDMLRRQFFGHVNPDKRGPGDRVRLISGLSQRIGENLWSWSAPAPPVPQALAGRALTAWMASRSHRRNLLLPRYRHLGVGAAIRGTEVRLTQVFRE